MLSSHQGVVGYLWISGYSISILCTTHFFIPFIPIFFPDLHGRKVDAAPAFSRCTCSCKTFLPWQEQSKCPVNTQQGIIQMKQALPFLWGQFLTARLQHCAQPQKRGPNTACKGIYCILQLCCIKLGNTDTKQQHTTNLLILVAQHFALLKVHQTLLLRSHLWLIFSFWLGTQLPCTLLPWHALTPIILPLSRDEVQCCQATQSRVKRSY